MQIACVLFPNFTQLDLTGPFEVFHRLRGVNVHLVAESLDPVMSEGGLAILPTTTFDTAPPCDVLFAPGGPGVNEAMLDETVIAFLSRQGAHAAWITSACTGSLLLGAAGLLAGSEATTHWASMEFLEAFGAWPKQQRVVISGNRITGAGVTSGIDVALTLATQTHGARAAEEIRLGIEYNPDVPVESEVREAVLAKLGPTKEIRRRAVAQAAKKMMS